MRDERALGVVGTLVWDRVLGVGGQEPFEGWGGIAYALAALGVALPEGWRIRPVLNVGEDRVEEALRFLASFPRVDPSAVRAVDEPTDRVELRYRDRAEREERLLGGVPPLTSEQLLPSLCGCDALYVNFISGFELAPEAVTEVCRNFTGPTYADLHSIFLGIDRSGIRIPRRPPDVGRWIEAFDVVQMNREELSLLAEGRDPWDALAGHMSGRARLALVTLGGEGSAFLAARDAAPHGFAGRAGAVRGDVPVPGGARSGDPTGCGDVWGGTVFGRLLAGSPIEAAMAAANRTAASKVEHRGVEGLIDHLASSALPFLAPIDPVPSSPISARSPSLKSGLGPDSISSRPGANGAQG